MKYHLILSDLIFSFNFGFGLFAQSSGNDGSIQFLSESEGEYIPENNAVVLRNKAQVIMEGMELYADLIRIDWFEEFFPRHG